MLKHSSILLVVLGIIAAATLAVTQSDDPSYASMDVRQFLAAFVPGSLHESEPNGVPKNYDWSAKSTLKRPEAPDKQTTYLNFWGQIYFDETNSKPTNTRVAVANCSVWGLQKNSNTWTSIMVNNPTALSGGAWAEDFQTKPPKGQFYDQRLEADGSQSFDMFPGYTAHYFPKYPNDLVNVGYDYSEFVTGCSTRLVKESNAAPDDRNDAGYLLSVGNDWRRSDYQCEQNANGVSICGGIGVGKFVRITNDWRRVMYSTLSDSDLASKPLPPAHILINPDGSFGDSEVVTYTPTSSTDTPPTAPTKQPATEKTDNRASTQSPLQPLENDTETVGVPTNENETIEPVGVESEDRKQLSIDTNRAEQKQETVIGAIMPQKSSAAWWLLGTTSVAATTGLVVHFRTEIRAFFRRTS